MTTYPQRIGEEDCRDFLRTGRCKYGESCKYHHPPNVQNGGGIKQLNPFEPPFPIRPTEPTCQYYLKHGTCKFGQTCKFHHPTLPRQNSEALPQRPGEPDCIYYLRNGRCKYGVTCKYHHPISANRPRASSLSSITEVGALPVHLVRNSDGSTHLVVTDGSVVMLNHQNVYPQYYPTNSVSPLVSPMISSHASSSYDTASTLDLMGGSSHNSRLPSVSSSQQLRAGSTENMKYILSDSRSNSDNSLSASIQSAPNPRPLNSQSLSVLPNSGNFNGSAHGSSTQGYHHNVHSRIGNYFPVDVLVDSNRGHHSSNAGTESFYTENNQFSQETEGSGSSPHSTSTAKLFNGALPRSEKHWSDLKQPSSHFPSSKNLDRTRFNSQVAVNEKEAHATDDDGIVTMTSAILNMLDIDEPSDRKVSHTSYRSDSMGSSNHSDFKNASRSLTEESSYHPPACHQVRSNMMNETHRSDSIGSSTISYSDIKDASISVTEEFSHLPPNRYQPRSRIRNDSHAPYRSDSMGSSSTSLSDLKDTYHSLTEESYHPPLSCYQARTNLRNEAHLPFRSDSMGSSNISHSDFKESYCLVTEESYHLPSARYQGRSSMRREGALPYHHCHEALGGPSSNQQETGHPIQDHSPPWSQHLPAHSKNYGFFTV